MKLVAPVALVLAMAHAHELETGACDGAEGCEAGGVLLQAGTKKTVSNGYAIGGDDSGIDDSRSFTGQDSFLAEVDSARPPNTEDFDDGDEDSTDGDGDMETFEGKESSLAEIDRAPLRLHQLRGKVEDAQRKASHWEAAHDEAKRRRDESRLHLEKVQKDLEEAEGQITEEGEDEARTSHDKPAKGKKAKAKADPKKGGSDYWADLEKSKGGSLAEVNESETKCGYTCKLNKFCSIGSEADSDYWWNQFYPNNDIVNMESWFWGFNARRSNC